MPGDQLGLADCLASIDINVGCAEQNYDVEEKENVDADLKHIQGHMIIVERLYFGESN